MATKRTVWQSSDGATYESKAQADRHELDLIIANEIMEQLGFNSHVADRIAKSYNEITRIVKDVKANKEGKSK